MKTERYTGVMSTQLIADMGFVEKWQLAIEYYGEDYVMEYAGYDPDENIYEKCTTPEEEEEVDEMLTEDMIAAAEKLLETLEYRLTSRKRVYTDDEGINFDMYNNYVIKMKKEYK